MKTLHTAATILLLSATTLTAGKNTVPPESPIVPVILPIGLYVGIGGIMTSIDRDPCPCGGDDISDHRYGGIFRIGYDFNQYFGVEARALKTFGDDAFSETTHYGVYLKPQYHISDKVNIYGLLGYGKTKIDYTNGILSSTTDENGIAYGIGIEYDLSSDTPVMGLARGFDGQGDQESSWGIWADFTQVLKDKGSVNSTVNIITAGVTYDF